MMLYVVESERYVTDIPHHRDFDLWHSRLTDKQFEDICTELLRRIEGDEVHTSSWIPGSDWTGTVFEPIYTDACRYDVDASGRCFGLFLWVVMMEHPDVWGFGRYEKDMIPIEGLTYFRLRNPPSRYNLTRHPLDCAQFTKIRDIIRQLKADG